MGRSDGWLHRVLAAAIVLVLGVGATMLYLRQGAEPVTADVALEQFRAEASATPPSTAPTPDQPADGSAVTPSAAATTAAQAPDATPTPSEAATPDPGPAATPASPTVTPPPASDSRPPEGVYSYRTEGFERVGSLGGSRHDYPDTTFSTLRHSACGMTTRWQPLQERWDETQLCADGPYAEIRVFSMYHEFFQQGQQDDYTCGPGAARVFDRTAADGSRWTAACDDSTGGGIRMTVIVIGREAVQVGDATVEAVRMRYEGTITGNSEGSQVQERWIDPSSGLMLRLTSETDVQTQSPIGPTHYVEQYRIDLESLTPRT